MKHGAILTASLLAIALPAHGLAPVVADPARQSPVFPRRLGELSTHVGGALGDCSEKCEDVDGLGYVAGLTLLFRPIRPVAMLVGWERAWFRWRPEGVDSMTAHATLPRIGARFYVLETARLDGWLEGSLIRPTWGASRDANEANSSLGFGSGAGLDVFVWDHLKLGPRAHYDLAFSNRGPTSGGGAVGPSGEPLETPAINLVFQLGLAATVTFGPPAP